MEKYKNKGLSGLENLGNTCFMNSCLQVISHTYVLNELLDDEDFLIKINKGKKESVLLLEWNKLRKLLWSKNCIIRPNGWLLSVQKIAHHTNRELFTGYSQNDLPEFLLFIFDCFHNSVCRKVETTIKGKIYNKKDKVAKDCYKMISNIYKKEFSEFNQMFYGIHVSQIKDYHSEEILKQVPEPYFMLDIPIPMNNKEPTLYDCLNEYCKWEELIDDNQWLNEKLNKKQDVKKRIIFWNLPSILIITLKRFANFKKKDHRLITYPLENLDCSSYVEGYNQESYIYDLYGICNHSGGLMGGHYTAYVKNANNKWYHYNDSQVIEVKNKDKMISPYSYCLFYQKKKQV